MIHRESNLTGWRLYRRSQYRHAGDRARANNLAVASKLRCPFPLLGERVRVRVNPSHPHSAQANGRTLLHSACCPPTLTSAGWPGWSCAAGSGAKRASIRYTNFARFSWL